MLRECLAYSLAADKGRDIAVLDYNDDRAIAQLAGDGPTVVVVDLGLPGRRAFHVITQLRRALEQVEIVALVSGATERDFIDAVRAGPTAYVSKWAGLDELRNAIESASRGESYCSPQIADGMLARMGHLVGSGEWGERNQAAVLSLRELEVLRLIAEGNLSNKQIARRLNISLYTVKNHVHNILEKLSVQNRHAAARFALDRCWL